MLRQELKEQARKSKEAVKEAGEMSRKFYDNQLKQIRDEYRDQSATLRKELKQFLEDSVNNIAKNQETKMNRESDERLDSLKSMIHEDFVEALQKKTEEIDLIRTDSENRIAEIVQESTDKSHRISQLEIKMKEISQYLPSDIQEEVYEQFGFEDELAALEEEPKPKRKGILGKLMSLS
jgi:F0F1-type ATP synthase membrane subunit b/b'